MASPHTYLLMTMEWQRTMALKLDGLILGSWLWDPIAGDFGQVVELGQVSIFIYKMK